MVSPKFSSPTIGELALDGRHASTIVCGQASGDREAPARRSVRRMRAAPDRLQTPAAPSAIAAMPACHAAPSARPRSHPQPCRLHLLRRRRGRAVQRDERAPVHAEVVGLAGVTDDPGGLQVSQPAPHIGGVRAQPPPAPRIVTRRHRPPPHDRREPVDELPDRARVVPGALGMSPAPQQPLDRIRACLEPIVATGATPPCATGDVDERVGLQPPGLGRQHGARGGMPDTPARRRGRGRWRSVGAQRHRQRPRPASTQRPTPHPREGARGTARQPRSPRQTQSRRAHHRRTRVQRPRRCSHLCAAVRLPVSYDRRTSIDGPVRGSWLSRTRKVGDATPAFPRQDAGWTATPRLNGQALAVSNRQRAVARQARESTSGARHVGDLSAVALATSPAHTALRRAAGRLRNLLRFSMSPPGSGTSGVGPIAGPNVPDDAVFRRRRGRVRRVQEPTNTGRAGLGGVASARFTRERSQVRNPPRPSPRSPGPRRLAPGGRTCGRSSAHAGRRLRVG